MRYKIVSKDDPMAVHSVGYYGESGRKKAQERCDNGYCARHWSDREQAEHGFMVVECKGRE